MANTLSPPFPLPLFPQSTQPTVGVCIKRTPHYSPRGPQGGDSSKAVRLWLNRVVVESPGQVMAMGGVAAFSPPAGELSPTR
eukprot:scaffold294637_cov33-Tisochrysis_lutea.AAC.1